MVKSETKKAMTTVEAGRKGGKTTLKRHGRDFFSKIGKKGGQRVKKIIEQSKNSPK